MAGDLNPSMSQSLLLQIIEQLSGVDQRIGVLQGQNGEIIREQQRAADGRREMYAKINRLPAIEAELARLSPMVEAHEKKSNQAAGAMSLGKALWAISAGAIGAGVTFAFHWLVGGGPPAHHP